MDCGLSLNVEIKRSSPRKIFLFRLTNDYGQNFLLEDSQNNMTNVYISSETKISILIIVFFN